MNEHIKIGKYILSRFDDETIWVQFEDGEGGQFSEEKLEETISAFYKENF